MPANGSRDLIWRLKVKPNKLYSCPSRQSQ